MLLLGELVVICGAEMAVVGVIVFVVCATLAEVNAVDVVGLDGVIEAPTDVVASADVVEGAIVVVASAVVVGTFMNVVSADVVKPTVVVI